MFGFRCPTRRGRKGIKAVAAGAWADEAGREEVVEAVGVGVVEAAAEGAGECLLTMPLKDMLNITIDTLEFLRIQIFRKISHIIKQNVN